MKMLLPIRMIMALALAVLVLAGGARLGSARDGFVIGFSDLPLMEGMTEIPDTDVAFDTTQGRIVIAFARSAVAPDTIRAFYRTALAQLGWRETAKDAFTREGEILNFDYLADATETIVRFSLLPE